VRAVPVFIAAILGLTAAACGGATTPSKPLIGTTTTAGVPSTTSTTLLTHAGRTAGGLVQHIWGNESILVPVGWVEHDEIPGGSSDTITFSDPTSPARLIVTINACALCGSTPSGQPEPSLYLPKTGIIESQALDPYRLAYQQSSTSSGYLTNGLIVDLHIGTTPNGTTTAAITLPVTQHSLATTILNSLIAM